MAEQEAMPKKGLLRRALADPRKNFATARDFGRGLWRELWRDHQFFLNTVAVKGGAAALVGGAIVACTFAWTLPFLTAVGIYFACITAVGIGACGLIAGLNKISEKMKDIYYDATGKPRPPVSENPRKTLGERLTEKPAVRKFIERPFMKKFRATHTWKTLKKLKDKQDGFLSGLAVGSSAAYAAVGGVLLAAQLLALPVIAIPILSTLGVVGALGYAASGLGSLWASIHSIRGKRKAGMAEKTAKETPAPGPAESLPSGELKETFAQTAAANDNPKDAPGKKDAPAPKLKG